jgi:hypothetical protein
LPLFTFSIQLEIKLKDRRNMALSRHFSKTCGWKTSRGRLEDVFHKTKKTRRAVIKCHRKILWQLFLKLF